MHVFVTGSTGLIGRAVCAALLAQGHFVTALSRSAAPGGLPTGVRPVQGDPTAPGPWLDALAGADACVHLAGEPVAAGRWTEARKRRIRESRVASTRNVAALLADTGPKVLVSASAIGIYGPRGDEPLDESSPPGDDFLARVCKEWEAAADGAAGRSRVVKLRTGLVLARHGGALPRMALPFRLFAGGPIGSGAFWQSWIHLADEVGLVLLALQDDGVSGPLNATAPAPVRNRELARALGRALHRPSLLPTPVAALRVAFGEMAGVIASGQRVLPAAAQARGYRFRFPSLEVALGDIYPG